MEDGSRFCVGFYCGLRSTQRTVVIESVYRTHLKDVGLIELSENNLRSHLNP